MVENGCSLLIKNLSFHTSPDKIRKIFQSFGKVRDVYLPLDHYTRRPRGFGFVEYYEPQYAKEALITLNHTKIDGNEVKIIIAQNRRKSPETMKMYQRSVHKGRYRGHPYRSDSSGKRIHRKRDKSNEEGRRKYYRSKSRITHKMRKKEKRLKGKKVPSRYRPGKKYSESASTYSASSSYRSSYSRESKCGSSLSQHRRRSRKGDRSWERGAVRSSSSRTTSYSTVSYGSEKGKRKNRGKNPKRGQGEGEKEGSKKDIKRQTKETLSRNVSLSKGEGASRDGEPWKEPPEGTDKHIRKDIRRQICRSFSLSRKSQERDKVSQNCALKRVSYSTEEEDHPGEETDDHGKSLKYGERVGTMKSKKKGKLSENSSEDTNFHRERKEESNLNEEEPEPNFQGIPTNEQSKQPYFLHHMEEGEGKKGGTKKNAKSVSPSTSGDINCEGVIHQDGRDKTHAEREAAPAKRVHREGSNNGSSSNKDSGSSKETDEEESSSPHMTKRKRICLSTTASNTNSTQMDHLPNGEVENGNGVHRKNKSSSSPIGQENNVNLKENLELCYLSQYDNAKGGKNFDPREECIGGNENSSSRTSSTYRGCRKEQKGKYITKIRRKKRINERHSTDRSSIGDKKKVGIRRKEGESGKTKNGHRRMMKEGREKRGRVTLSVSESRDRSNGEGETAAGVIDHAAIGEDEKRERFANSAVESLGRAKITMERSNTPCCSNGSYRGSPVGRDTKRGNTQPESVASHRSRTICDVASERPDGEKGIAKGKKSISGNGSDGKGDDERYGRRTRRLKRSGIPRDAEENPREKRRRKGQETKTGSDSIDERTHTKRKELQKGNMKKMSKISKSKKEKFTKKRWPKKSYDSSTYSQSSGSRSLLESSIGGSSSYIESSKMEKSMNHFSAKGSKGKEHKRDMRRRRERRIEGDAYCDSSSSISYGDSPVVRSKR
ncbi:RNA-binding protein, putative [Plasmodium knowlesi strain H]|uniref:RNA-binding protein, putative n=3 Tax=Plasmodium knowlesi TaxID=5850 RepID=A0A5K1V6K9_PLAKH|nr:alternative splicing factor SR-MG, putative [Plasmodium knowlesi strain H]OTN65071.1 putative RNA binding protein [Plasmodium knowlesi]CAA9988295.1 alternative splicing factor SR-MG, putative [Plasmodium knowlesi strain H]SBO20238.1 RNA-binding protein, putative [Plasmodium knowlesi strain H]SBO20316.1 RNA-binding protein, putative [Plasmodium knowlesi strain H]VVS77769.1 alternative splicing factor SR-MG, putative [Plasmodium knowlesi strain H]|eukprot:XP_002259273.1 RNA binding protein, putative [Plasmodium knowlesi strain H]